MAARVAGFALEGTGFVCDERIWRGSVIRSLEVCVPRVCWFWFWPGLRHQQQQQPWNRLPVAGRFEAEEENAARIVVSPKRERESTDGPLLGHHPSLGAWDNSAPGSPSHHSVRHCCSVTDSLFSW